VRKKLAALLMLVLLPSVFPAHPGAQETPAAVFSKLQDCVDDTKKNFPRGEQAKLVGEIGESVKAIKNKWRAARDKGVPADYLGSLKFDCDLLALAAKETDGAQATAVLRDVNDDLKVKAQFARGAMNAAEVFGAEVRVTVKTMRSDQEVGGYLIRCNPKRYADNRAPMFVFNSPSSPTSRNLPPGNYRMWAEDDKGNVVKAVPVTIGADGNAEEMIRLDVPQGN